MTIEVIARLKLGRQKTQLGTVSRLDNKSSGLLPNLLPNLLQDLTVRVEICLLR